MARLEPLFLILGHDITLFGLKLKFQDLSVMLGVDRITIGVKNQAPRVPFKNSVVGDSISVSSHEFNDMKCCDFLDILNDISNYVSHTFTLHGPIPPFIIYMVTCSFPQKSSKNGGHHHLLGDDTTTFDSSYKEPKDSYGPNITFIASNFKY